MQTSPGKYLTYSSWTSLLTGLIVTLHPWEQRYYQYNLKTGTISTP